MAIIIVAVLLFCFLLIATEYLTNINKAAVAIFAGTLGWVLYICHGTDFVMSRYPEEFAGFIESASSQGNAVKEFIAQYIFLKYVGRAAEIVIFLLATMSIVEILNNNGCFDFIRPLLKTRNSKKMLWSIAVITFILSANLDNLPTTVMMLTIMHELIVNRRQRILFGASIVVAANCGGALTVIGDPTGLLFWNLGAVSATDFSQSLFLPCVVAWFVSTWLIGRMLPERCDTETIVMPYRGNDTLLRVWQRLLMLFVGIGGLWFIPTFHNITKLSPFLGALCVLAILWIVNELCNRRLIASNQMVGKRVPSTLQYGVIQMILYVMGLMLAVGVVVETGAIELFNHGNYEYISNPWIMGGVASVVSVFLDNFATATAFFSLVPSVELNDPYWHIIAYAAGVGGNILCVSSMSGIALMKMERVHVGHYFKSIGLKTLVGFVLGFLVMLCLSYSSFL